MLWLAVAQDPEVGGEIKLLHRQARTFRAHSACFFWFYPTIFQLKLGSSMSPPFPLENFSKVYFVFNMMSSLIGKPLSKWGFGHFCYRVSKFLWPDQTLAVSLLVWAIDCNINFSCYEIFSYNVSFWLKHARWNILSDTFDQILDTLDLPSDTST